MALAELASGTILGDRYRLEHVLGEGGMGVVWAAVELEGGRRCAIKLLRDDLDDPDARRRFSHEARAAEAVQHPHVVSIHGVLELEDGRPAIVMELLEGETLREVLARRGRLPLEEVVRVLAPVIAAVGAAHALGVVHRDLKPENIFLARTPGANSSGDGNRSDGDGGGSDDDATTVKILDFGIAKMTALDGETMRTTGLTTGKVLGTPAYMAPEQVYGQTDLDHRVDIWALGLVFYQALSGVLPTQGDNIGQVFRNVTARPFEPLLQLVPGTPPALAALIARMLARERAERPADLREVVEELAAALDEVRIDSSFGVRFDSHLDTHLDTHIDTHIDPPAAALLAIGQRDRLGLAATVEHPPHARPGARSMGEPPPGPRPMEPAATSLSPAPLQLKPVPRNAPLPTASLVRAWRARLTWPRFLGGGVIAILGALLLWRPGAESVAARSPLAAASSRLACPILRASGVEEPSGWLGAAAAAVACERSRVLLGGRPERTLVPAELLDLPDSPAEGFPEDPFGQAGARERSIAAARQRGQAYLDGEVAASPAGFTVTLSLRRPDGSELAGASGRGRGLYEAVRAAMAPLIGPRRLPAAAALEPEVAAWARTAEPAAAMAWLDLQFAFAHNAGGLADECVRFAALGDRLGVLGPEGRWMCGYVQGRAVAKEPLGAADGSPAGLATRLRVDYLMNRVNPEGAVARLRALRKSEPTPRGRALLAATESCMLGSSAPGEAHELALLAVRSEPKNPEGGLCNPWELLMTTERDTPAAGAGMRAIQGWMPWNSAAWREAGYGSGKLEAMALPLLRRAYALSPLDATVAGILATATLAANDQARARSLAVALRDGPLPLHQVQGDLLLVQIDASEAHFGAALRRARRGSELVASDAGWLNVQRFDMAWSALELAVLLGEGRQLADELVARFLTPRPSPLDSHSTLLPMRLPALCALASKPAPCFARLHELHELLPAGSTADTGAFLAGAELYAAGKLDAAAEAWRPLLGGRLALAQAMPDAMAEAFEHNGDADLAANIDDEVMKRAGELHGATLGHVRAARRALRRGDRARARQLAEQVVAAWKLADQAPPALAEMRRLLARL